MDKPKGAQGGEVPAEAIDPNKVLNKDNYDNFVQEILTAHNHYRSLHGVVALELKDEVKYSINNSVGSPSNSKNVF